MGRSRGRSHGSRRLSTIDKEEEVNPHLDVRSLLGHRQPSGMECPICFEQYAPGSAARGPRESAPTVCVHVACHACWVRVAKGPGPFRCAMCRADSTRWVARNFCTPMYGHTGDIAPDALRREVAERLEWRFPHMDVDWLARIPRDLEMLEALMEDLSLALGLRAP